MRREGRRTGPLAKWLETVPWDAACPGGPRGESIEPPLGEKKAPPKRGVSPWKTSGVFS